MKKRSLILGIIVLACVISYAKSNSPWETRPIAGVRDTYGASKWWTSVWRTGDRLSISSEYKVEGRMCVKNPDKLRWYDYLKLNWRDFVETDHKVTIEGRAKCLTNVLLGSSRDGTPLAEGASVQLLRRYECPMSSRGASVVGLKNGLEVERDIRSGMNKIYEVSNSPEMRQLIDEGWNSATEWVADIVEVGLKALATSVGVPALAEYTWVSRPAVRGGMDKAKTFLSKKSAETYKKNIERLTSSEFKEGGLEAKKKSPLYFNMKSKGVDEAKNFAITINELFAGKWYYVASSEGDQTFGRELLEGGDAYNCYMRNKKDLLALPDKMYNVRTTPDEEKVSGIFTRETLNVNAKLFDASRRNPGDVWRTDGSVLNNFLHPDLKGEFSGEILMKYTDDREITLENAGENQKQSYKVRHLRMVTGSGAEGTYLSYVEPGDFRMRYSASDEKQKTSLDIYVDLETGYIVKIVFSGRGEVEMLPNLLLTSGWGFREGKGDLSVYISAESIPERLLRMKK